MALINKGNLVSIRPVEPGDLPEFAAWHRDSDALGGFNAPGMPLLHRMQKRLEETGFMSSDHATFSIETCKEGKLVGKLGYFKDNPMLEAAVRTFIVIARPEDRGHGYATEAHKLMINYLFLSTSLERIYSETEEENHPTRRLFEKSGMQMEGVARHLYFDLGRWVNMAVYSIIRNEWEKSSLYSELGKPFIEPWWDRK